MKLYNTLSKTKEEIMPIEANKISLYTCGPTVYHYMQIGNLRKYVFDDLLKRALAVDGYDVKHVMNITDVGHLTSDADEGDDKLQTRADQEGKTVWEVAEYYTKSVFDDFTALGIQPATVTIKATDTIDRQIALIKTLIDNEYAYQTEQAIYFDVTKAKDYGKLSGQSLADKEVGVRSEVVTDTDKHHPQDFALWFFTVGHFEHHAMRWNSPWGEGFPGWHIECSAIIEQELGETIDIHTGGVDHIGTHHTNEIAQSEAAHAGKPLANIWMHQEFLLVDSGKMSKSRGTAYRLADVVEKGFDPLALRMLYLQSHYRTQQNFTWEALGAAQNALRNIQAWADLQHQSVDVPYVDPVNEEAFDDTIVAKLLEFQAALDDDLNTPKALAVLNQLIDDTPMVPFKDLKHFEAILAKIDAALGLQLIDRPDISEDDKQMIQARETARENGEYEMADKARENLRKNQLEVDDTPHGPRWRRV